MANIKKEDLGELKCFSLRELIELYIDNPKEKSYILDFICENFVKKPPSFEEVIQHVHGSLNEETK